MKKNVSFEDQDNTWTQMSFFRPGCENRKHNSMTLRSALSRGPCDDSPDRLHIYGDCCMPKINGAVSLRSSWDPSPGPRRPDREFECHM